MSDDERMHLRAQSVPLLGLLRCVRFGGVRFGVAQCRSCLT